MRPVHLRPAQRVAVSLLPEFLVSGGPAPVTPGVYASFCLPSWLLAFLLCFFALFSFLLLFLFLLSSRLFLLACSRVHVSRARVFFFFIPSPFSHFSLSIFLSGVCFLGLVFASLFAFVLFGVFSCFCVHIYTETGVHQVESIFAPGAQVTRCIQAQTPDRPPLGPLCYIIIVIWKILKKSYMYVCTSDVNQCTSQLGI